jgi:hypothetical protein
MTMTGLLRRTPAPRATPLLLAAALSSALSVGTAEAQSPEALRAQYRLALPAQLEAITFDRHRPNHSVTTPTAFGLEWLQGFVGVGWQERARYISKPDGAVAAGFGFGNPRRWVGGEVAYTSFSTIRSGFFTRSALSVRVHRAILDRTAVAVGWENAVIWGPTDGGSSRYAVATHTVPLGDAQRKPYRTLTGSLGVGNGRFRSEMDIQRNEGNVGVFGSVALRPIEPLTFIADWTGQDLAAGASVVPVRGLPFVITFGFQDLLEQAGDGRRFTIGAGGAFDLREFTRDRNR